MLQSALICTPGTAQQARQNSKDKFGFACNTDSKYFIKIRRGSLIPNLLQISFCSPLHESFILCIIWKTNTLQQGRSHFGSALPSEKHKSNTQQFIQSESLYSQKLPLKPLYPHPSWQDSSIIFQSLTQQHLRLMLFFVRCFMSLKLPN